MYKRILEAATRTSQRMFGLFNLRTNESSGVQVGMQNKHTRDQWLSNTLTSLPQGSRILDAGAGQMQYRRLCSHLDYVSQDFGQYDGSGDENGLQTGTWQQQDLDIVCDIASIPEPSASFDAIMCTEVLEHIPHPIDALREFSRLLKPGGMLIITAPFCSLTHYSPYFFQTGYSRYFYDLWLAKLGFEILDLQWNGNYFEFLAQELRRVSSVGEQYAGLVPSRRTSRAVTTLLQYLAECSEADRGSEQLLSFGLHVIAKRHIS